MAAEDDEMKHSEPEELRCVSKMLHERHTTSEATVETNELIMKWTLWETLNFVKHVPKIYVILIVTVSIPFLISVTKKL